MEAKILRMYTILFLRTIFVMLLIGVAMISILKTDLGKIVFSL